MIGGIVMILVVLWAYQAAVKASASNIFMWVAISAVTFFVVQMMLVEINIYVLEAIRSSEGGSDYERDLTSIGDRKNEGGFQGIGGVLESLYFELMPPFAGFLAVALIRTKFIMKEKLSVANLFSGLGDMFQGIKNSFKTTEK